MNRSILLPCLATLLALSVGTSSATVIFDNNGPDLLNYYVSDFDPIFGDPFQASDDFLLQTNASTITDVHWWGAYLDDETPLDAFTIRIFEDDAGAPDVNPLHEIFVGDVGRADTGGTIFGTNWTVYEYWVDIAPIALSANTTYWLSIVNDTPGTVSSAWLWATSDSTSGTGNNHGRNVDGDDWQLNYLSDPLELAFNLTGGGPVVPEPATMTLLGLGLAGFALRRRKMKA